MKLTITAFLFLLSVAFILAGAVLPSKGAYCMSLAHYALLTAILDEVVSIHELYRKGG